jgi:hypothetical protein
MIERYLIPLAYKPDWEESVDRYSIWWEHGYYGRCALAVTASLDDEPDMEPLTTARVSVLHYLKCWLLCARIVA